MKKYISAMAVGMALMALSSCSKDTEGLTGITYYPVIEINGSAYDEVIAGTPYTEPGYSATLNGEDYTDNVVVTTDLDFSNPQPGYYAIIYSAVNADGFSTIVTRHVLVTDSEDPVSGYYTVGEDSFRDYNGIVYFGGYPEVVYENGDGTYHISDLIGGWYEYRAGYGPNYTLPGEISIDADGNIELLDSYQIVWQDSANELTDGKFDAASGTIKYVVSYTDYPFIFHITMVKN